MRSIVAVRFIYLFAFDNTQFVWKKCFGADLALFPYQYILNADNIVFNVDIALDVADGKQKKKK